MAGGDDREVDPAAPGRAVYRGLERVLSAGVDRLVHPAPLGDRPPERRHFAAPHPRGAERASEASVEEPDGAETEHEHRTVRRKPDPVDRGQCTAGRLEERADLPAHRRTQPEYRPVAHVLFRDAERLREPAGVDVRLRVLRAEGVVSARAHVAGIARNMVVHEHPVAHREVVDPGAHFEHAPDRLVPQDPRAPVVAPQLLEVRSADPARGEGHHDLPGSRVRSRNVDQGDRAVARELTEFHSRARAATIAASRISIASSISSRRTMSGGI